MAASKDKLKQRATVAELAQIIERSEVVVRQIIGSLGLKRDKQMKYLVSAVVAEHIERQKRDPKLMKAAVTELDDPVTWADKLKAKQVEKLDVQIQELRGNLLSKDEMRQVIMEHVAAVQGALENWVQLIAANRRDPDLLKWAEDMQDRAVNMIRDKLNDY